MARISQSDELAKLKGADKKHPGRYRNNIPKSDLPLGKCPTHIKGVARHAWYEISMRCIPGTITFSDGLILEIAANLMAEYRIQPTHFMVGKYAHLISCLARLGLSPADRTKLNVPGGKEENPYDHLDD